MGPKCISAPKTPSPSSTTKNQIQDAIYGFTTKPTVPEASTATPRQAMTPRSATYTTETPQPTFTWHHSHPHPICTRTGSCCMLYVVCCGTQVFLVLAGFNIKTMTLTSEAMHIPALPLLSVTPHYHHHGTTLTTHSKCTSRVTNIDKTTDRPDRPGL